MPALVPLQDPTAYAATVTRFNNQGETQYSDEKFFLPGRIALSIVAGTSTYSIPEYVRSIRRVTWLGHKLDPLAQRNFREVFQSATQQGRPFWYVFNNVGQNKIQLFPNPDTTLPIVAGDVWGAGIPLMCIIEFWRISDNSTFVIPPYQKSQMLKHFVNRQLYSIDGPGQNLKLSKYFGERWEFYKKQMSDLIDDLYSKPRKIIVNEITSSNYFPASPVLPISRFGISVNEGE